MRVFESDENQHTPGDDVEISQGVNCLLRESAELLQAAMSTIHDPHVRRAIGDTAKLRHSIHRHLDAAGKVKSKAETQGCRLVAESRSCYRSLRNKVSEMSELELLAELQQADKTAVSNLRQSVKAVSSIDLASRLASAAAKFQMSSDKLRSLVRTTVS